MMREALFLDALQLSCALVSAGLLQDFGYDGLELIAVAVAAYDDAVRTYKYDRGYSHYSV